MDKIALDQINLADEARFVALLADIYEHSPWVAARALARRPFASLQALHDAMVEAVMTASADERLALVRAHPDIAGKAARAGALTEHSTAEQTGAGLDRLTEAEYERFHRLNAAYRAAFGFPFIICVRRHTKDSILRQFERRVGHAPDQELSTAVDEIGRIAALRLDQLVAGEPGLKVHGRLSTHVLDTQAGRPAAGVNVELVELSAEGPERVVARAVTNPDGRTDSPLIANRPLPAGTYELRFAVGAYFRAQGHSAIDPPFLDVVPVRFGIAEPEGHYHVPLLATPWSFSTYRGS